MRVEGSIEFANAVEKKGRSAAPGRSRPQGRQVDPAGDDAATARPAAAGFRSPATRNAFERLASKLVERAPESVRGGLEELLRRISELAADVSATDSRPYGRSVEHRLKQLFIQAARELEGPAASAPVADAGSEEVAPPQAPDDGPAAAVEDRSTVLPTTEGPAPSLDFTA